MNRVRLKKWMLAILFLGAAPTEALGWRKPVEAQPSPLDVYVEQAKARSADPWAASPGSLYAPGGRLGDLVRDPRAFQIDDIVTIVVSERASAVARGATATARKANSSSAVAALAGALPATGALANLADLGGESKLDGQGQTSRETVLSTSLSARVSGVLPNGYLVLEAVKTIGVNSESQVITVRGVCRPQDLSPGNIIRSERLAQLEVRINGKGVVGDAVRRPFVLYRILQGLLPF